MGLINMGMLRGLKNKIRVLLMQQGKVLSKGVINMGMLRGLKNKIRVLLMQQAKVLSKGVINMGVKQLESGSC